MDFYTQMCENTKTWLHYPYQLDADKLIKSDGTSEDYPEDVEVFEAKTFEDVLRAAFHQPYAFKLTDTEVEYYSQQELDLLSKVVEEEKRKLEKDYQMVNLELNEETKAILDQYCKDNGMTIEEAAIDLFTKAAEFLKNNRK